MSKILPMDWNVDFAMDDERENERMKEATNEMASLFSPLNIGSEEYARLVWKKVVD